MGKERKGVVFVLLLHLIITSTVEAAFGVSVGINGGGGGVWIGGGFDNPAPSSSVNSAYSALQAWKSAISDDPLKILDTWVGTDVCSYKGVFCSDPQNGVVGGIDLNHANLQGTLVKEISLLTDLTLLHLNTNRFSGTIPQTFRDLVSLQELDLSNNRFSGPFPMIALYIPNLVYFDIRYNTFSGPLPEDLFNKKLDAIFVNNNQFSGQIPQNLGNSPASVINLANNKLTGSIPFGLGSPTLKEILFLNNQLSGCIPLGVGLFSEMQVFDVSFNSLMGHLPDTFSCLNELEVLNLAHNQLSGELSDVVCSLGSLMNLTVAFNFFSGFSQECTRLFFRDVGFDFSANCIPGRNMQRPQPDCSAIPGGGLSCLRIPALHCGSLLGMLEVNKTSSPSSP